MPKPPLFPTSRSSTSPVSSILRHFLHPPPPALSSTHHLPLIRCLHSLPPPSFSVPSLLPASFPCLSLIAPRKLATHLTKLRIWAPQTTGRRKYTISPTLVVSSDRTAPTGGFTPASSTLQSPLKITNPRKDGNGNDMVLHITPRAVQRLHHLMSTTSSTTALRIRVEAGGCHGFQYLISLEDPPVSSSPTTSPESDPRDPTAYEDADTIFDQDGARVIIDGSSLELLNGASVDYTIELVGRQFKVVGIPGAGSSCGCGTSFDIKI